jgi:hypothetical protein
MDHRIRPIFLALACLGLTACDGGEEDGSTDGTTSGTTAECALGDLRLADGRCQPPGLPLDMKCPPGETPLGDGSCQAAGVPPDECGDGFAADGDGGCTPILPEEDCPFGLIAVPGETECREVAPCGSGTWGDIPVEADTELVDGSYPGDDSDGTQQKPWKTIQEGVDAAASGAIVAIAAGTYAENVVISFAAKRLWGRCPAMTTIQGVDKMASAVQVVANGSEIHALAVTGPNVGVHVDGADDLLIDAAWIHDTGKIGVLAVLSNGTMLRGSLVESVRELGVQAGGASLTMEGTVVRDVLPPAGDPIPNEYNTIAVSGFKDGGLRSNLTIRSSLVERTATLAMLMFESDCTMEGVAVRETLLPAGVEPMTDGFSADGLIAVRSNVDIVGATFEHTSNGIIVAGSQATLERVTVSHGWMPPVAPFHHPLYIGPHEGEPSSATVRQSTVADNPEEGMAVIGSSATIESLLVRDNGKNFANVFLPAVIIQDGADATFRHTVLTGNQCVGFQVASAKALFEESVVRDMLSDSGTGRCAMVYPVGFVMGSMAPVGPPGDLTIRSSLLEDCSQVGAGAIRSNLIMETSVVRDIRPREDDGFFGDGIIVLGEAGQMATAKITGVRVEKAERAGISAFGGQIDIGFSSVSCTTFDLVQESWDGLSSSFNKLGDNACGCPGATELCSAQSPGIGPP